MIENTITRLPFNDDGAGFANTEKIDVPQAQGGIGIPNTYLRLKQLYGTGLDIMIHLDEVTTVSFCIPKEHE